MGHVTERDRIDRVRDYLAVDVDLQKELDDITALATAICEKPISLITLLDETVNFVKASTGTDLTSGPREVSFCQYTIQGSETLIVEDARQDARFDANPLVHADPGLLFYAGAPLVTSDGFRLGTLCVFDVKPSSLTALQQRTLEVLSRQATFLLETGMQRVKLREQVQELEEKNESLRAIAQLQSHDIRQPLMSIAGLLNLAEEGIVPPDDEWLGLMRGAVDVLDGKIHAIVNESMGNHDIKLYKFNKMVEEIEDYAILLLDPDGVVENWNRGAERIKGYTAGEIVGRNFSTFYTEAQQRDGLPGRLLHQAAEEGTARDTGLRVRKGGGTFTARVVITAIHSPAGAVIGFTKVTRDISEKGTVGGPVAAAAAML